MKKEWSPPQLYDANGDLKKRWFVYYYENGKRKRVYGSINLKKTKEGRLKTANTIIKEYVTIQKLAYKSKTQRKIEEYMASRKGFWKPKTFMDYKSKVNAFFFWLGFDDLNNRSLRDFFLNLMEKKKSPTTYNNYRTVLKQVLTEALELREVETRELFQGIKSVKSNPTPPSTFSMSNINRLKNEILEHMPNLWLVCQLQYYCFIRPGEIRCLKVGDIIMEEQKIIVHSTISKNKKTRYPVIPPAFINDLELAIKERHLGEYLCPSTLGINKQAGINSYGNWHRKILGKVGLPTKRYKLYSWKPTGMLQAIKKGASMKFLKEQAGHYSIDQTDSYLRSVGWRDDDNSAILFPEI